MSTELNLLDNTATEEQNGREVTKGGSDILTGPSLMRRITFPFSCCPLKSVVTCKCKCNRLGGAVSLIAFEYCPQYNVVQLWKLNVKQLLHFHFNMAIEAHSIWIRKCKFHYCTFIFMVTPKVCGDICNSLNDFFILINSPMRFHTNQFLKCNIWTYFNW